MTKLEFIVFISIVGILAIHMILSLYSMKREREERLVKDHIVHSLDVAGKKLDKSKMYYFSKKANKIIIMDNPNFKSKEESK